MKQKTYIARDEVWCEQNGTRLLIEKDEFENLELTIKCGHIEVKATLAQFRIDRLVAVASAKRETVAGEVSCPKCGNYYGGHATGSHDICCCHMP